LHSNFNSYHETKEALSNEIILLSLDFNFSQIPLVISSQLISLTVRTEIQTDAIKVTLYHQNFKDEDTASSFISIPLK